MSNLNLPNAHGTWHVTTEGDCEGRSTRDLGVHTGYLDEIALQLAEKAYYGLRFKSINQNALKKKPRSGTSVMVSLGIETGTWDLRGPERVQAFKTILKDRPVHVGEGQYFATVTISTTDSPEMIARMRKEKAKAEALEALTPEQIAALKELGV